MPKNASISPRLLCRCGVTKSLTRRNGSDSGPVTPTGQPFRLRRFVTRIATGNYIESLRLSRQERQERRNSRAWKTCRLGKTPARSVRLLGGRNRDASKTDENTNLELAPAPEGNTGRINAKVPGLAAD